jgi:sarcosine oxidase delta subunit
VAIIYTIPYPNTGKAYIGSSISEREDYYGSMCERGIALRDADQGILSHAWQHDHLCRIHFATESLSPTGHGFLLTNHK